MDGFDSRNVSGSLQISTEVIEKIAQHAAQEIEGVVQVRPASTVAQNLLDKLAPQKPVLVNITNDVADITISLVVAYDTKIPDISEKVQQNVKEAIQNMTSITVARVDVVITGIQDADKT